MDRIENCISFAIGKAAQQITRRARELLAPHGVTPGQYAALKVVTESDGIGGAELGERLVLDSASITGIVDRLESLGLVERRPNPDDRRAQRIVATKTALKLAPKLDAAMDQLNMEASRVIAGQETALFKRLRQLGDEQRWKDSV